MGECLRVSADDHVAALRESHTAGTSADLIAIARIFKVEIQIHQESGGIASGGPNRRGQQEGRGSHVSQGDGPCSYIAATCEPQHKPKKQVMLALVHSNHYDIVYTKREENMRAYCQSLMYER